MNKKFKLNNKKFFILLNVFMLSCFSLFGCTNYTVEKPEVEEVNKPQAYEVKVTEGSGSGFYNEGSTATIHAYDDENKKFLGWYTDGNLISEDANYSFTVTKDMEFVGTYANKYAQLKITGGGYEEASGSSSTSVEVGTQVSIAAQNDQNKQFSYFEINGEQITNNPYTFKMPSEDVNVNTVFEFQNLFVYVDGGTINGVESSNIVEFEYGQKCTISYLDSEFDNGSFHYWYIKNGTEKEILSNQKTYEFEVTKSLFIYPEITKSFEIKVLSGKIESEDAYEINNSSSVSQLSTATIFADAKTTITYVSQRTDKVFDYWYQLKEDSTEVFLSDKETYTFSAFTDLTIYPKLKDVDANKLQLPSYITTNDIFRYGINTINNQIQYLEFLRFTNNIFDYPNVDCVKLYIYDDPDADRTAYLATIIINLKNKTFTFEGNETSSTLNMYSWSDGSNIYFEGGNLNLAYEKNFYLHFKEVIKDFNETGYYFFAMQLVAKEGYKDSDISTCSRIAFTMKGTKSTTPVE